MHLDVIRENTEVEAPKISKKSIFYENRKNKSKWLFSIHKLENAKLAKKQKRSIAEEKEVLEKEFNHPFNIEELEE